MSLRVRMLQSLVLGLIGLSLILYTSLFYSPIQIYPIPGHSTHDSVNSSIRLVNYNESRETKQARVTNGSNPASSPATSRTKKELMMKSVSRLKAVTAAAAAVAAAHKGILTKDVYDAGHIIPNADLCPELGRSMKLMILITSSPDHAEPRMAIRQTWGHFGQRKDIGVGFMVGLAKIDKQNEKIQSEFDMYGDIIQSRFVDSYENLTLKTVSMFEWVDSYCSEVPFVLKTDDDMFINIPKLLALTEKQSSAQRKIFGRLAKKWKPIRNTSSKYFVGVSQFPQAHFPDFTTGPGYLVTKDAVHDMYSAALNATFLKLEDVFMTGVVAQNISVKRVHVNEFYNKRIPYNICNIRKAISIHMVKFYEQFILWEKLHDTRVRCK